MVNMTKKLICIVLIVFMLISSISNVLAFDIEITKDNLTEAFNEYAKGYSGGYTSPDGMAGVVTFEESTPIEVTDSQLINKIDDDTTYTIDYSLENNPKFSIKTEITNETELSTISDLSDYLKAPTVGIIGVLISQGANVGEAHHYYGFDVDMDCKPFNAEGGYGIMNANGELTIQKGDETKTFKQDNFKASELVTFLFKDKKVVEDEEFGIFTYTVTTTEKEADKYEIQAVFEINKDADFSKVVNLEKSNETENSEENKNSTKKANVTKSNSVANKTSNTNKANTTTNKVSNTSKNTTKNTLKNTVSNKIVNSVVDSTNIAKNTNSASENDLPKTGENSIILSVIWVIILVAFIFKLKIDQCNKKED